MGFGELINTYGYTRLERFRFLEKEELRQKFTEFLKLPWAIDREWAHLEKRWDKAKKELLVGEIPHYTWKLEGNPWDYLICTEELQRLLDYNNSTLEGLKEGIPINEKIEMPGSRFSLRIAYYRCGDRSVGGISDSFYFDQLKLLVIHKILPIWILASVEQHRANN